MPSEKSYIMEDLRIKRTKAAIENATIELIELKGFANVRLTEIAEKAMVNRNTIYLHYKSKEDIVMSIIGSAFMSSFSALDAAHALGGKLSKPKLRESVRRLILTLNEQVELYRIVLTDPNLSGYLDLSISKIKDLMYKAVKQTKGHRLGVEYIVNGTFGVISRWIIYATGSIDEVTNLLTDFIHTNIRQLLLIR